MFALIALATGLLGVLVAVAWVWSRKRQVHFLQPLGGTCDHPKTPGWYCTLERGHTGPCPLWPGTRKTKRQFYGGKR